MSDEDMQLEQAAAVRIEAVFGEAEATLKARAAFYAMKENTRGLIAKHQAEIARLEQELKEADANTHSKRGKHELLAEARRLDSERLSALYKQYGV